MFWTFGCDYVAPKGMFWTFGCDFVAPKGMINFWVRLFAPKFKKISEIFCATLVTFGCEKSHPKVIFGATFRCEKSHPKVICTEKLYL